MIEWITVVHKDTGDVTQIPKRALRGWRGLGWRLPRPDPEVPAETEGQDVETDEPPAPDGETSPGDHRKEEKQ